MWLPDISSVGGSVLKRKATWAGEDSEHGNVLQNELLRHFVLGEDPEEDARGVRIKACAGVSGLNLCDDRCSPGETGYAKGTVIYEGIIKALCKAGYVKSVTLEGAPYDWRLAPGTLRRRGYFDSLRDLVERLNRDSPQKKGVIILAHSMGNKVVQYFLNMMKESEPASGQQWLDQHIHTWIMVGAPTLGAAYTGRMAIVGDSPYPGITALFSQNELLYLFRSLGSLPWLFPIGAHAQHLFYVRREGAIDAKVSKLDLDGRAVKPGYTFTITFEISWGRGNGAAVVTSGPCDQIIGKQCFFSKENKTSFLRVGGPPELPPDATIKIVVNKLALFEGPDGTLPDVQAALTECWSRGVCGVLRSCLWFVCFCGWCQVLCRLVGALCHVARRALSFLKCMSCSIVGKAQGREYAGTPVFSTATVKLSTLLPNEPSGKACVNIELPLRSGIFDCFGKGSVSFEMRWRSREALWKEWAGSAPPSQSRDAPSRLGEPTAKQRTRTGLSRPLLECFKSRATARRESENLVQVQHSKRPKMEVYDAVSMMDMLKLSKCHRVLEVWKQYYHGDPFYNDAGEDDVPPVHRVVGIYGQNVETEIMSVLRINSDRNKINSRFILDMEAELKPDSDLSKGGSVLKGGVVYDLDGDGVVPPISLARSCEWKERLDYTGHVLRGSSHTTNMLDPRVLESIMRALV